MLITLDDSGKIPATFADDHYLPDLKNEHVKIVGQLPEWADARWYLDLVRRRGGQEVKSRWVLQHWGSLGSDLRSAAERCIREALITISDSAIEKLEMKAMLETRVMKRPFSSLEDGVRQQMESFVDDYVERTVLACSPAYDAMHYVGGCEPDLGALRRKLGNGHNVRVFAARIAAALVEYLDPNLRGAVLDYIRDRRYWTKDDLTGLYLSAALAPHRTFDQGNRKVLDMMAGILEDVADRIRRSEYLVLPAGSGAIAEGDSARIPHIAVADIAAGIAGRLYRSSDGLRRVVDRFRMVILNGAVVRV